MIIQFTELLVKAWIQARFPSFLQGFNYYVFSEERRSARYLFLRVLLGVGVIHNRMADTKETLLYIGNQWVGRQEERKTAYIRCIIAATAVHYDFRPDES